MQLCSDVDSGMALAARIVSLTVAARRLISEFGPFLESAKSRDVGCVRGVSVLTYENVPSLGPRVSLLIWRMAPRW
jgi:hypothetical protein